MRVVTFVGTRPEIIRLSRVICKLDLYFDHVLVHTGQNYDYELNEIFFSDLELREPDHYLECAGDDALSTIARVIERSGKLLAELKPDAVLVLGDTNSCLSVISAKRLRIPIFHMEAGNRCFDLRVPEEINRKIVDHTADINLPYSDIAREYLLAEGFPSNQIITTGSPLAEVLSHYSPRIARSDVLEKFELKPREYFVLSMHREENVDDSVRLIQLHDAIENLAACSLLPIVFSVHPRTQSKLTALGRTFSDLVIESKPLAYTDYMALQKNAKVVISDSGTITEESAIAKFPAITLRQTHERPEGFEESSVVMCDINSERLLHAISVVTNDSHKTNEQLRTPLNYSSTNVAEKVARTILSYTDFVNREVWKKNK